MALLTDAQIDSSLSSLRGWTREGDAIRKQFVFEGFPEAVAFVGRLVPGCEAADHHPDITINYKRVTLAFSTHSEHGLTVRDFAGARAAEAVL
jgi:4a-hydroxytetrahydrobiopterin dehydratase